MGRHLSLVLVILFMTWLAGSSQPATANNILKGVPNLGMNIVVERLDPEARKAGLNEASLQKVVAARLKKRLVSVNPNADFQLYVRVVVLTSMDTSSKVLGFGGHVELSFKEKAFLAREKTRYIMAPTWFKGAVTVANAKHFPSSIVVTLANLTDQFLRDFK